jgi:catechol 2,3-dioxygenase-like lactoylglutathione lyase family enzyme
VAPSRSAPPRCIVSGRDASKRRGPGLGVYSGEVHLGLVAVVVSEYDPAISFFVNALGFELVEDSPSLTNDGRPKRWVVVRPPGAITGLLLARADGDEQVAAVGKQAAGRVGFFLHVDDFHAAYARMVSAGVQFVRAPRNEPYGDVAVFVDIAGNRWDLIGPTR